MNPGDTVQVHNPHPLSTGTVLAKPSYGHGRYWVRVQWEDGDETNSRLDLLRLVEPPTRNQQPEEGTNA